jgi:hypothetical protein
MFCLMHALLTCPCMIIRHTFGVLRCSQPRERIHNSNVHLMLARFLHGYGSPVEEVDIK